MDKDDKSLIAWYRCEGVSGDVLVDEISGQSMTLTDTTIASGGAKRDGRNCISFNGTTSKAVISSPTWHANTGIQSVALWFNASKTAAVRRLYAHTATAANNRLYISFTAGDVLQLTAGNTSITIADSSEWNAGVWNHVVVVRDATNNRAWAYFNGKAKVFFQAVSFGTPTTAADIYLGTLGGSEFYDGLLDDVRVYNRFVTEAEAKYIIQGRGCA